ncbi:DUF1772 domain-containing protein [Onishia niordana]|uniref:DUF1772 domain-containing protein n=1 Tax=Onishia niordana TaxID=2508711 RepID=UPI00109F8A20|nr:DUF1772 domain-containing protein [Halomonas niordiana]
MDVIEIVAIMACTIFAGAAVYINVAEHPARLSCGTQVAATVFGPSYQRAAIMQASLAILAAVAGAVVALGGGGWLWWLGALAIFAVVPFTFIVIMPTNKQLLEPERDRTSEATRRLLVRWGRLHAVRSALSLVAALLYVSLGVAA